MRSPNGAMAAAATESTVAGAFTVPWRSPTSAAAGLDLAVQHADAAAIAATVTVLWRGSASAAAGPDMAAPHADAAAIAATNIERSAATAGFESGVTAVHAAISRLVSAAAAAAAGSPDNTNELWCSRIQTST